MVNQSPREPSSAPDERADVRPDGDVLRLLDAAAAPAEAGPLPGEDLALAAFRASHRTRRISMFSHPTRAKAAVAATIGAGTFLFAGVGAAAAGVLPDPAQDAASSALGAIGFEVPRANDHAGAHPAQRGPEDETTDDTGTGTGTETTDDTGTEAPEVEADQVDTEDADGTGDPADPADNHGQDVSDLAKTTDAEGADKGAEISDLASGGKSKAGEEHGKPEHPGSQAGSHKPATGDDSTDDSADDSQAGTDDSADDADASDKKADGPSTAGEKSGGRSHAGSKKTRP